MRKTNQADRELEVRGTPPQGSMCMFEHTGYIKEQMGAVLRLA